MHSVSLVRWSVSFRHQFNYAMKTLGVHLLIFMLLGVSKVFSQGTAHLPSAKGDVSMGLDDFGNHPLSVDVYADHKPALKIIRGDGQTASPNDYAPQPLKVSVQDERGQPMINAPVTFTVTQGEFTVQASGNITTFKTLTVRTNVEGQAKVYVHTPNQKTAASQITCTVATGPLMSAPTVNFHVKTDDGSGEYDSPFGITNVVATMNSDMSADVTWTNNAEPGDTEPIDLMYRDVRGNWKLLATVPAGTTSYHVPAK